MTGKVLGRQLAPARETHGQGEDCDRADVTRRAGEARPNVRPKETDAECDKRNYRTERSFLAWLAVPGDQRGTFLPCRVDAGANGAWLLSSARPSLGTKFSGIGGPR
jgi:hypothetical protein